MPSISKTQLNGTVPLYNDFIRTHLHAQFGEERAHIASSSFVSIIKDAARRTLTKIHKNQNREYISQTTWNLIKERQAARVSGQAENEKRLNKEIAKQTRKNRQIFKIQNLEALMDKWKCWQHIRMENNVFTTNSYSMRDICGNRVPVT